MVPMDFQIYFIGCLLGNQGVKESGFSHGGGFPEGSCEQSNKNKKAGRAKQNLKTESVQTKKQKMPKTTKSAERIWA